ncbi:hypothetical protein FNV43_RR08796 [Rhamnella rubrinervis]|uniref:Uncharacterized protein n=1 Tax=Rhamnella rubrinervis TaxID=2594499 RepID=A0A8K0MJL3_9ROSA|nr:hypothetical protein FNV43_RR08796 [Rhamnella rubrinervis]
MSDKPKDVEKIKEIQRSWIRRRRETLLALLRDESLVPPSNFSNDSSSDYFTEEDSEEDPEEDPEKDSEKDPKQESERVDKEIGILEYKPEMEGGGNKKTFR